MDTRLPVGGNCGQSARHMRYVAHLILRSLFDAQVLCRGLTLLFLCVNASAQSVPAIKYRSVEYSFSVFSAEAEFNQSGNSVWWEYPVFEMPDVQARDALNSWARGASLQALAAGAEVSSEFLANKTDHQVMQWLAQNRRFVESGVDQSVVTPMLLLGIHIGFDCHTEWTGGNRPLHGVEHLYFNTSTRQPVAVKSLFRDEALGVLNDALEKKISKDRRAGRRTECFRRSFDWHQISITGTAAVGISFPYDPAEWDRCGEGIEIVEGKLVTQQLLRPSTLAPTRRIQRTNWGAKPVKVDPLQPAAAPDPAAQTQ